MLHLRYIEDTGVLPTSQYKLMDGEKEVGLLQLRHKPSIGVALPKDMASHIYYEINENERGMGYGNEILALAKTEAKHSGMNEILLSVWEKNIPSKKIIEKNGGELVKQWFSHEREEMFLLYKISLI